MPLLMSTATATRVDGGWEISGHKIFGSLTPVWTLGGFHAMDSSGETPMVVHGFMPRDTDGVQIVDTWDTLGMRATQSQDTVLDKAFVPDELIAREFTVWAANRTSPVVEWLRALAAAEHGAAAGPAWAPSACASPAATRWRWPATPASSPRCCRSRRCRWRRRRRSAGRSTARRPTSPSSSAAAPTTGLQVIGLRFRGDRLVPERTVRVPPSPARRRLRGGRARRRRRQPGRRRRAPTRSSPSTSSTSPASRLASRSTRCSSSCAPASSRREAGSHALEGMRATTDNTRGLVAAGDVELWVDQRGRRARRRPDRRAQRPRRGLDVPARGAGRPLPPDRLRQPRGGPIAAAARRVRRRRHGRRRRRADGRARHRAGPRRRVLRAAARPPRSWPCATRSSSAASCSSARGAGPTPRSPR